MAEREHGIMNESETVLLKKGTGAHIVLLLHSHLMLMLRSLWYALFFLANFHHLSELNSLCSAIKFNLALMQFDSALTCKFNCIFFD